MPALKCFSCEFYSDKEGCKLERENYYHFRDCMTGKKDYSFQKKQVIEETLADYASHIENGG